MKNKHIMVTFGSVIFVMMLVFASQEEFNIKLSSPTGQFHEKPQFDRPATYAYNLNHHMQDFFLVPNAVFPDCVCADLAKEIGGRMDQLALQVAEDFTTYGPQRVSTRVFGIEQEYAGGLEMIYGKDLVNKPGQDSAINLIIDTVVRLPRLERSAGIEMTLYGQKEDRLYINVGMIQTPMLECYFKRNIDDTCDCMCDTGMTHEYANI